MQVPIRNDLTRTWRALKRFDRIDASWDAQHQLCKRATPEQLTQLVLERYVRLKQLYDKSSAMVGLAYALDRRSEIDFKQTRLIVRPDSRSAHTNESFLRREVKAWQIARRTKPTQTSPSETACDEHTGMAKPIRTVMHVGYRNHKAAALIETIKADPELVLVDVRYGRMRPGNAYSQHALSNALEEQFMHVRELGNINFKSHSEPMKLANPAVGLKLLEEVFKDGGIPVLMCACASLAECHRNIVLTLLIDTYGINSLSISEIDVSTGMGKQERSKRAPSLFDR